MDLRFKVAVCDDDKEYLDNMSKYLSNVDVQGLDMEYETYDTSTGLLKRFVKDNAAFDVVFIDIEIDDLTGIELANTIRSLNSHVIIVFVTSHKKYTLDCLVCRPFGIMIKPIEFDYFKRAFAKIIEKHRSNYTTVEITVKRQKFSICFDDIIFLQAVDHNTYILTRNQMHMTYMTLSEVERQLDPGRFVRVHRAYIVNMSYIKSISDCKLYMDGYSHEIPIGTTYRQQMTKSVIEFEERNRFL